MKKLLMILVALFLSITSFSQGNFKVVQQQQAQYPAGDIALQEYFNLNLKYPQAAIEKRLYGNVMLSFNVMSDSTLSEILVLEGVGYGVDEEVVKLLTPLKFSPAISNSVVIRSGIIISINIKALPRPELEIEKL